MKRQKKLCFYFNTKNGKEEKKYVNETIKTTTTTTLQFLMEMPKYEHIWKQLNENKSNQKEKKFTQVLCNPRYPLQKIPKLQYEE